MRVLIAYDSRREAGATHTIAECIAKVLRKRGAKVMLCRVKDTCSNPGNFDLIVVGTPIYYEHPMKSILEFIDKNGGLKGLKVAVFITCLAASKKIPSPIRNTAIQRYLNSILKRVKGEVIVSKAFKGWLQSPDLSVLEECAEWSEVVLAKTVGHERCSNP